ncbi:beta-galactosidase family protein [Frigoribacterium sp. VKM Ac-2836]|uniref:glycoside hydrolase family 35 protein n=1 Tax=Frigoribacterium sp. VKM Ac-2836 TaxID=2739014 RepID=UPI00156776F7|nr:beta-galactosidase family protein [Frigoribacterium sp. VKM Ac-2836]NRD27000.1 beta-galactosidase [Frigoribacterium sp. VKM Ac-2836]
MLHDTDPSSARFVVGLQDFELDGRPHRVIAGALHYFRVHPDQWADRIHKARLMGLNTIETYVAWNAHSPRRGTFDTDAGLDLGRFLDLVAAEDMHAIVRPGPYICAEWDGGGLPGWLFDDPSVGVRRSEPLYLAAVDEFLRHVYEIVVPRQIDHGGPVVLVQIENEYGAYGDDAEYLRHLVDLTRASGVIVPLTTVDQPTDEMLARGSLPELHRTGSFGSRAAERLATLRRHQPTGPLMCSEFWDGWFDHWGEHHHTTPVDEAARELDAVLAAGASVNVYMFHGGTNFGFTNGANHKGTYHSHVTSYDYDAPLDEAGWPTDKFFAFRDVIARHAPVPDEVPERRRPAPVLTTTFDLAVPLEGLLGDEDDRLLGPAGPGWVRTDAVPSMDELGTYRGFTRHRVVLPSGDDGRVLSFGGVRDRAIVSVDGRRVGVLQRDQHERSIAVPSGRVLEVLVEDLGRVNYGSHIGEPKGLIGPAVLDGLELVGWQSSVLGLDELLSLAGHLSSLATPDADTGSGRGGVPEPRPVSSLVGPVFAHATVTLDEPADLYLDTRSWGKGVAFVNGFALGRYWTRGPQHTLYVPGEQLRAGDNDLVVFETGAAGAPVVSFVAEPDLGHLEQ